MFGLKTGRISPLFKGMNGKLPSLAIIFFILIDVFIASFLFILVFDNQNCENDEAHTLYGRLS